MLQVGLIFIIRKFLYSSHNTSIMDKFTIEELIGFFGLEEKVKRRLRSYI